LKITLAKGEVLAAGERTSVSWSRFPSCHTQIVSVLLMLAVASVLSCRMRFVILDLRACTHDLLFHLPIVLLVRFSVLQIVGIKSFAWRYIGMAEVAVPCIGSR